MGCSGHDVPGFFSIHTGNAVILLKGSSSAKPLVILSQEGTIMDAVSYATVCDWSFSLELERPRAA